MCVLIMCACAFFIVAPYPSPQEISLREKMECLEKYSGRSEEEINQIWCADLVLVKTFVVVCRDAVGFPHEQYNPKPLPSRWDFSVIHLYGHREVESIPGFKGQVKSLCLDGYVSLQHALDFVNPFAPD